MRIGPRILLAFTMALAAACGGDDDGGGGGADADVGPPFGVTAEREWAWVDIDGNYCMDGSDTGIGVNLVPDAEGLVIFLQGGGACFNSLSCMGVANQNGFGEADLDGWAGGAGGDGILDRSDTDNPVRDWSFIFVPYCTGDVHAGSNESGFGDRTQVGFDNVTRATELAAAELGGEVPRVLLVGQSAGGFGAMWNYDQVSTIFGDVPVDLLDDSGPPMSNTYLTPCFQEQIVDVWGLDSTVPDDCDDCLPGGDGGFIQMVPFLAEKYAERRIGIISSLADETIRQFYAFGYPDCETYQIPMPMAAYEEGVVELRDEVLPETDNARAFTVTGTHHVFTNGALGDVESGGANLADWIVGLLEADPGWDSVAP
jgi:hypothetical protein